MSLAFLSPASGALAAVSPITTAALAAGATIGARDGWDVAVDFPGAGGDAAVVAWADASHIGTIELLASEPAALAGAADGLSFGAAVRDRGAWWCLMTPGRALVLPDPAATAGLLAELSGEPGLTVTDVTTQFCALRIAGPQARETFARFCAMDLRPRSLPVGGARAGSVARVPGLVIREGEDAYLAMVGAAYAEYFWTVVSDAGQRLGGRPVGVDRLGGPDA